MPLYEHIMLARQDVSAQQVEDLTNQLTEILTQGGGKVTKNEYWGLKSLSYRIKKNRKAHYSLMNIDAPAPAVAEMERQMLWRMLGADHPMEAHKVDSRGIFHMGASPDVAEGIAAFKEKRAPKFGMRVSRDMPPFYPWWEERTFK
jgi:ribosomal protein S6